MSFINNKIAKITESLDIAETMKVINDMRAEIRAVHENQAEIIPALVSIYELQLSIARKVNADIPTPKTNMELE